jgi:hypothetical protein
MRRFGFLVVLTAFTVGCADLPHPQPAAVLAAPKNAPSPSLIRGSRLGLIPRRNESVFLFVGDSQDQVERLYPRPPGSFDFRELPPAFQQPYRADGWETPEVGFGALYYESRLAEAMRSEQNITEQDVLSTEADYQESLGKPSEVFPGVHVMYWFWEDSAHNQRLMICAVQDKRDAKRFDLTTSVGDVVVMDALRMSPAAAREDRQVLEKSMPTVAHPG